jgi:DNA-directed RNA polymerase subunit RPC12/RpoP
MDGIGLLSLALMVALVLVGITLAALRQRQTLADQKIGSCARCLTPMSLRRVSILESLMFRRVWMCPHCGTRVRKRRNAARTASL